MQRYLLFLLLCLSTPCLFAQDEIDSGARAEDKRLEDLLWIKDTIFGILKSKKFGNLKTVYPTFKTYQNFIDSSKAGDQSSVTQYAMYNTFWNRLRLQYFKLHKKTSKAGIDWDETKLDSFHIDSSGPFVQPYAYIRMVIQFRNKKKYLVSALFLKMGNKWFLMDELRFEGALPEKQKKKSKSHKN